MKFCEIFLAPLVWSLHIQQTVSFNLVTFKIPCSFSSSSWKWRCQLSFTTQRICRLNTEANNFCCWLKLQNNNQGPSGEDWKNHCMPRFCFAKCLLPLSEICNQQETPNCPAGFVHACWAGRGGELYDSGQGTERYQSESLLRFFCVYSLLGCGCWNELKSSLYLTPKPYV